MQPDDEPISLGNLTVWFTSHVPVSIVNNSAGDELLSAQSPKAYRTTGLRFCLVKIIFE